MRLGVLAAVAVALAASGCSKAAWDKATAENVNPEYHSGTEIPPGPGLFTGKTGSWQFEPPAVVREAGRDPAKPREAPPKK